MNSMVIFHSYVSLPQFALGKSGILSGIPKNSLGHPEISPRKKIKKTEVQQDLHVLQGVPRSLVNGQDSGHILRGDSLKFRPEK